MDRLLNINKPPRGCASAGRFIDIERLNSRIGKLEFVGGNNPSDPARGRGHLPFQAMSSI